MHLRAASFRVLCHSEIESYLEDLARDLHSLAWKLWKNHSYPSHTLTCLLGFTEVQTSPPAETLEPGDRSRLYADIRTPLEKANRAWSHSHRMNNGVKEENVLRLFLPIGIGTDQLDQTLLNDLSSFGTSRGEIAHKSPTSTIQFLDPKSELETVQSLVEGLRSLDDATGREIARLKRVWARLAP